MVRNFSIGDRVAITRGSFKSHQYGTFLRKCGLSSCYVKVDRDVTRLQRRLLLSSIAPINKEEDDIEEEDEDVDDDGNKNKENKEETLDDLLKGIAKIRLATNRMEKKIKELIDSEQQHR